MKAFLNWSGGKDSAFCLYKSIREGIPVEALVTTVNKSTDRVSMHGVRRSLLEKQAAAIGLPLYIVELPQQPDMKVYEHAISQMNQVLANDGFTHAVSGDLFLEDLKAYRTSLYVKDGIRCLFPLWKMDSRKLMNDLMQEGFKAVVVCVNARLLDRSFCSRIIDHDFLRDLPPGVDICGEHGEYHSFVFEAPIFHQPISIEKGNIIYQEYPAPRGKQNACFKEPEQAAGFYFCDILPG